jgi:hypothetical protein
LRFISLETVDAERHSFRAISRTGKLEDKPLDISSLSCEDKVKIDLRFIGGLIPPDSPTILCIDE